MTASPNEGAPRFSILRQQMVRSQVRSRGIREPNVLKAMESVPREEFVPVHLREQAYEDCPLPIGFGQTISQPFTVAFMAEALQLTGAERVLEIGTGSGYGAAVLSCLAAQVHTIERISELGHAAVRRIRSLGYHNVLVHQSDGSLGLPDEAPFDAIVVTASALCLPRPYVEQLVEGGRVVMPVGPRDGQVLLRVTRCGDDIKTEDLGGFAFVPLIGEHGWRKA